MQATWERQIKTGAMDSRKYKSRGGVGAIRCKNGTADVIPGDPLNTFRCSNVRIPQGQRLRNPPRAVSTDMNLHIGGLL